MFGWKQFPGDPAPLGLFLERNRLNFAIYSSWAEQIHLCLLEDPEDSSIDIDAQPCIEIPLCPNKNRSGDIWHIALEIPETDSRWLYGYRVWGKEAATSHIQSHRAKLASDPYARVPWVPQQWAKAGAGYKPLGRIVDNPPPFDWKQDAPLNIPWESLIIYEAHLRSFTADPSSGVPSPGTFLGMIEKLDHLKALGINALELMPIFEFNECEVKLNDPTTEKKLLNVWGYSPYHFFSPMRRFSTPSQDPWQPFNEFKTLVQQCHERGIEVILDVVFNHTGEGNEEGYVVSFKALDNSVYYLLNQENRYANYSGTGNSFNVNHPIVTRFVIDVLSYWVEEMHVDGFRFDLAALLTRDSHGAPLSDPPLLKAIQETTCLQGVKMIAEPWDAGGLYMVGRFPAKPAWPEWNDHFRDTTRRFLRGEKNQAGAFASVLAGSESLYKEKAPHCSINFITAHDGFSLRDLVCYQEKKNEKNGENNQDGSNHNESWNCGEEGSSDNPFILKIREQQQRNFLGALFLALGTPMMTMGDEYGHTRFGNNNSWCQDNHLNWFSWSALEKSQGLVRFCQKMIALRKKIKRLHEGRFFTSDTIRWHGTQPNRPSWEGQLVAYSLAYSDSADIYIAFNSSQQAALIILPEGSWVRLVDSSLPSPNDFEERPALIEKNQYRVAPHSLFVALQSPNA